MQRTSLALAAALAAWPAHADPDDRSLPRLAAELSGTILTDGRALADLEELTDRIGPRLTGTAGHLRAASWAVERFREAGLKAHLENFTIPNGWERGSARARLIAPIEQKLQVLSVPWGPSTPGHGVTGEIFVLGDISAEALAAASGKLSGKIVLLDMAAVSAAHKAYLEMNERLTAADALFKKQGVLAVVWGRTRPGRQIPVSGFNSIDAHVDLTPGADLAMEDFALVKRLLEKGPVRMELQIDNRVTGPTQVPNVVAELPGREPGEWVLIGAHLDSWDQAGAAEDNGAGVVSVIETARVLAARKTPPRRTIRFALWGGEEEDDLGSRAFVREHAAELDNLVAMLNDDLGPGQPRGWATEGRTDVETALKPLVKVLDPFGAGKLDNHFGCWSDNATFFVHGVPTLDLAVDSGNYHDVHHLTTDTFDKVEPLFLGADTAILAITTWMIADRPDRFAPRITAEAVDALLEKADDKDCRKDSERPF